MGRHGRRCKMLGLGCWRILTLKAGNILAPYWSLWILVVSVLVLVLVMMMMMIIMMMMMLMMMAMTMTMT